MNNFSVSKGDTFTIGSNPPREIEVRHASPVGVLFKVEGVTCTGQQVFFIHANDTNFWRNARLKSKVS